MTNNNNKKIVNGQLKYSQIYTFGHPPIFSREPNN